MRSCHFCGAAFRANETLVHFGRGVTVAYDRDRGRLWAICGMCGRWSLEPMDSRWSAIEEIDRLAADRGKTMSRTDNVAYMRADRLTIVRVGAAAVREEAWWRYGEGMLQRNRRAGRIERWGRIRDSLLISLIAGFPLPSWRDPAVHVDRRRRKQFGPAAWGGALACARCGRPRGSIGFDEIGDLHIRQQDDGGLLLAIHCEDCERAGLQGGARVEGAAAAHLLRRVLAYRNYRGGGESEIARAAALVENAGSAAAYTAGIASRCVHFGTLQGTESLALEISANAGHESELLSLEASVLERRWREEEAIAAIVDGELS